MQSTGHDLASVNLTTPSSRLFWIVYAIEALGSDFVLVSGFIFELIKKGVSDVPIHLSGT